RAPGVVGGRAGGAGHAPAVRLAVPDRDLVLVAGQGGEQRVEVGAARGGGQVDEAAPGGGVVEGEHGAEPPDGGLVRCRDLRVVLRGDGAAGDGPERGGDAGGGEGLGGGERGGGAPAEHGVLRVRPVVECGQREHPVEGGPVTERAPGEAGARRVLVRAGVRHAPGEDGHGRAAVTHGGGHLLGQLGRLAGEYEPVSGQRRGGPVLQQAPGHPVAPRVEGGLFAAAAPPGGQRGQHLADDLRLQVHPGVAALGGGPEAVVLLSGLGPGGGDPVAGVLEGVGRQVHETAAGRPGDGDAADVQFGGGGQGAFRAAVVAAERAGDDGGVPAQL